jgi:hypothetical protein
MVTWFDWGEYAIWHFGPDIKVSLDGRRETVYSDAWVSHHLAFYRDDPAARRLPHEIDADYIWLPNRLPIAQRLSGEGWSPIFDGPISTVWAKRAADSSRALAVVRAPRCFPGP